MSAAPDVVTASDDYARRFAGPVGAWLLAVQAARALELLEPWAGGSAVDVGGGHAQLAPALVGRGWDVTVTGSAPSCRARLDRLLPAGSFRFERCDLAPLPFAERAFDVALAFRLLTHLEDWEGLVGELCRVARHAVLLEYPDRRSVNLVAGPLFGAKRAVEGDTRPFRAFSRRQVAGALRRHGFRVAALRPELFLPLALHRAAGSAALSRAAERLSAGLGLTRAFGSPVLVLGVRTP
jgi:SAM-dependent methyltransferase